jgi:hypothetical protein
LRRHWLTRRKSNVSRFAATLVLTVFLSHPALLCAEDLRGVQPLLSLSLNQIASLLPPDAHTLFSASALDQFLGRVDGAPPDWNTVYGHGHHDSDLDDRLFSLNRERDAKREGNEAFLQRVAFVWSGELSGYDPESGGFRIALGPKFTPTTWGVVRFKHDELPGNLIAVPDPAERDLLLKRKQQGQSLEIDVVMVGRLIPEESIVYDFSHDEEGLGLIMPVVRVERIFYLRAADQ